MANQNVLSGIQLNRGLLVGGVVLTGVGAVLGVAGAVMVSVAVASAGRSWVRQLDTPPSQLASRKLQDAKAASMAGWEVWRAQQGSSN
ncbi:hypothetical protein OG689_22980 [Kitasatospora sp. NBC_00240]|uniref:hypothetical protein n=1 Tax=Kitasatospora sp. NBC_00240 TaxID=2903567 RepID=UPI0022534723|nr:hypothetical protein [Kitasatospora sp. NBC_00240]MCX5212109.1 hypothetical protein [Kitasatospora sp. NBC_00240]